MRPRSYFLVTLRSAVAVATLSTAAHAQSRATRLESGKVFDFTPYVGYMVFGPFSRGRSARRSAMRRRRSSACSSACASRRTSR